MHPSLVSALTSSITNLDPTNTNPDLGPSGPNPDLISAMQGILTTESTRDPVTAFAAGQLTPAQQTTTLTNLAQGNVVGAGESAVLNGLVNYIPTKLLADKFPWLGGINKLSNRVVVVTPNGVMLISQPPDKHDWPATPPMQSSTPPNPKNAPIGHRGSQGNGEFPSKLLMTVSLGNLKFEIPPAVTSYLPIHGGVTGQVTPEAHAGISFKHIQNIAALMIPGGAPVYQSLGIQGQMIEFVGMFLGFDYNRLLNSDLTNPNWNSYQSPDPLYTPYPTNPAADYPKEGAWDVSRGFQDQVSQGVPQTLIISSGVVKIKYQLLVTQMKRIYQRDDRVYYAIQGFAIGGGEDLGGASKHIPYQKPVKKPLANILSKAAKKTLNSAKAAATKAAATASKIPTAKPVTAKTTTPSSGTDSKLKALNPSNLQDLTVMELAAQDAVFSYQTEAESLVPISQQLLNPDSPVKVSVAQGTGLQQLLDSANQKISDFQVAISQQQALVEQEPTAPSTTTSSVDTPSIPVSTISQNQLQLDGYKKAAASMLSDLIGLSTQYQPLVKY